MSTFELRPPPGARDPFAPRKPARPSARRASLPRASLQRYSCPCGCGHSRWFTQPRVPRSGVPAATTSVPAAATVPAAVTAPAPQPAKPAS